MVCVASGMASTLCGGKKGYSRQKEQDRATFLAQRVWQRAASETTNEPFSVPRVYGAYVPDTRATNKSGHLERVDKA